MLNLIPAPRGSVHMQEGSVKLPETVTVSLGDFASWCLEAFAARLDGHVEIAENGFITLKKADIGIAMGVVGMVVIIVKLVLDIMNGESHLFPNKTTR